MINVCCFASSFLLVIEYISHEVNLNLLDDLIVSHQNFFNALSTLSGLKKIGNKRNTASQERDKLCSDIGKGCVQTFQNTGHEIRISKESFKEISNIS